MIINESEKKERDIYEERNEVLDRPGGDYSGGLLMGMITFAVIAFLDIFLKLYFKYEVLVSYMYIVGILIIMLLSWGTRVFYASTKFIFFYLVGGSISSFIYMYYTRTNWTTYSFFIGSLFGYILSYIEITLKK